MKMNREIKNMKNDLILNFNIKEVNQIPSNDYIESKWEEVINWLEEILDKGNSFKCYQEIYLDINDLLITEIPREVITKIERVIFNYSQKVKKLFDLLLQKEEDSFFEEFNKLWLSIVKIFNLLRKIMNRYEKMAYGNIQKNNVYEIFLDCLKKLLVDQENEPNKTFINYSINQVLKQIGKARENFIKIMNEKDEKMDIEDDLNDEANTKNDLLKKYLNKISPSIKFYCETGIYQEYFNSFFIKYSDEIYNKQTEIYLNKNDLEHYIIFIEEILSFENTLILTYLNELTLKPIINNLNNILIRQKTNLIFEKFFASDNKSDSAIKSNFNLMKKIYILLKNIKLEDEIRKKFNDYILKCCHNIYNKYNKSYNEYYYKIDELKQNIDSFISNSFIGDEKIKASSKEYLIKGINNKPNFICETFNKYIDEILRKTAKELSLQEIKEKINEFLILFKFIEDKDLFQTFFSKNLCVRCLYNLNVSEEAQNYLLEQLKIECGSFFVSKSQDMIEDIKISSKINNDYQNDCPSEAKTEIPIQYFVLSNYTWPIEKIISGKVNDYLDKKLKLFKNYFVKHNTGKNLDINLPFCSSEIEFISNNGKKNIIIADGIQTIILKMFTKTNNRINFNKIIKGCDIPKEDLLPSFKKLISKQILIKEDSKGKEEDVYTVNFNFDNKNNNEIILINIRNEESKTQDIEESEEKTPEEKRAIIDAYIMKALKHNKILNRSDLLINIKEKISFPINDDFINKRIDKLVDDGYIFISENDKNVLKYF